MRIISLVPSLTEYLWALGLEQEVVGITKFCVHPTQWWQHKTRVGGTKKLNFATISALQPTLIIANKEENKKEDILWLQSEYEVLLTDINTLDEAFFFLLEIGKKVKRTQKAQEIVAEIKDQFTRSNQIGEDKKFLYFIWKDPYFVVGPNTYIHSLLSAFGLTNCCKIERYPNLAALSSSSLNEHLSPDFIFLSSEPFPFEEKHILEVQALFPNSKVKLVDGEICSWYGIRMLQAPSYIKNIFG
ncbi:MAG: ABC transporter substrate-binding protein [Flavobacteriales bacterium]